MAVSDEQVEKKFFQPSLPLLSLQLDHPYALNCHEAEGQALGLLSETSVTSEWESNTESTNEAVFKGTQTVNNLLCPVFSPTLEHDSYIEEVVPVKVVQSREMVDVVHLPKIGSRLLNVHQTTAVNFGEIAAILKSNEGGILSGSKIASSPLKKPFSTVPVLKVLNAGGEPFFILSTAPSNGPVESKTNTSEQGCSQSSTLTSTNQPSVYQQFIMFPPNLKTSIKTCSPTKKPNVKKTCSVSYAKYRDPFPNCTNVGLDLNVRSKEKRDLKFLTNGVMVEIQNFASKITTAFQYVVFDILDHNFDLCLLSEERWRFVKAVNSKLKQIRKKYNKRLTLKVFTLPDLKKKVKPLSKATLLAKASQDKDSSLSLRQKLAKQKRKQCHKRRYISKYQVAKEEENAVKFQKAYEAMNNFLMTWFYHDRQVPSQVTNKNSADKMYVALDPVETATLVKVESDPHPRQEHIFCNAGVTAGADEPAVIRKNGAPEIEIKVESDLVLPVQQIKIELKSEPVETLCTSDKDVPCQKIELTDISIKDEPEFHPISSQIKEEAPCNGIEDALYTDHTGKLGHTHDVYINNESDLYPEMQGNVRTLERSHLVSTMERTLNNPYPYCRRIGLDLVKSKLGIKKKLNLQSLTVGVMLEIYDFAKDVCASSQEIAARVIEQHFHLDLEKKKLLYSENIGNRIKRFPKHKALKEKLLKEPYQFTSEVQKPFRKRAALPKAPLLSENQKFKEISVRRRLDLKKKKEERAAKWTKEEKQAKKTNSVNSVPEMPTMISLCPHQTISKMPDGALMTKQRTPNLAQWSFKEAQFSPKKVLADIHPQEESDPYSKPTEQALDPKDNEVDMLRKIILDIVKSGEVHSKNIFNKITSCIGDPAAPEKKFKHILTDYTSEFLPHVVEQYYAYSNPEKVILSLVNKLFCGLHLIDCLIHQSKTALILWECMIFGDKLGLSLSFGITELESGTVRLVRSVCDSFQARGCANEDRCVKFKGIMTGQGEFHKGPLASSNVNRLDTLCLNAAWVYSIHDDLVEFTTDNKADSLFKEVVADLKVQQFKAGCRALGLISKLIIDPLSRALTVKGNILNMEARYQTLVSKLKEWHEDGRQFVEGNVYLFDDIEVINDLVFQKLTMCSDPNLYELTVQIVELLLASFLRICSKMLSSYPNYCRHILATDELREKLWSMSKNASLKRDFGLLEHLQRAKSGAIGIAIDSMVMFKKSRNWDWLLALDIEKKKLLRKTLQRAVQHQKVLSMEGLLVQNVKGNLIKSVVKHGCAAREEKLTEQNFVEMTVQSEEMDAIFDGEEAKPQQSTLQFESRMTIKSEEMESDRTKLQLSKISVKSEETEREETRPKQMTVKSEEMEGEVPSPNLSGLHVRAHQSFQLREGRVLLKRLADKPKALTNTPGEQYALMKHDLIRELEKCGSLWEKEVDMDEHLAILDEDGRYSAVICQIRFWKYVLCMKDKKGLLNNSVGGRKCSFEELVTNLRMFILENSTSEEFKALNLKQKVETPETFTL